MDGFVDPGTVRGAEHRSSCRNDPSPNRAGAIAIAERQYRDVLSRGRREREAQGILRRRMRRKTPRSVPTLLGYFLGNAKK